MWLEIITGPDSGTTVRVGSEPFYIGRGPGNNLRLSDQKASRQHAVLTAADSGLMVEDLNSENGTLVRGVEISAPTKLTDGDEIRVGDSVLRFSANRPVSQEASGGHRATVITISVIAVLVLLLMIVVGRALFFEPTTATEDTTTSTASTSTTSTSTTSTTTAPTTTSTSGPGTVADVVDAARPSVLRIITVDREGSGLGSGSGWVFDADGGLIATNNHVISGGASFVLAGDRIMDGEQRQATLIAAAPCEDLAIIRISDPEGLSELELGTQAELRAGEDVVAIGFPSDASLELPLAATAGVVSVVQTSLNQQDLFDVPHLQNVIRTDAAINPGNSGGPLLTLDMQVVGVNTAGFTERNGRPIQNENYAIGIDRARDVLEELAEGTSIGWAGLGLETFFDQNDRALLVSTTVVPGSPADRAGVPATALIIEAINGTSMDGTLQRYCDVVGDFRNQTATFIFVNPETNERFPVEIEFGLG